MNSRLSLCAACVVAGVVAFAEEGDGVHPADNVMTFVVNGYTGTSTLKDFPVLVRLSETQMPIFRYADCREDGSDLVFCAPDSDVEYPCDIETWDPSGTSYVWVRVPELAAGTSFRLRYGGDAVRTLGATNTWERPNGEDARGGYAAVWHMASPSGASVPDASGNGMDAERYNAYASPAVSDGAVGIARRVSGEVKSASAKLKVSKDTYTAQGLGDTFTASVWVRTEEVGDGQPTALDPRIFSCKSASYSSGWEIEVVDNTATFNLRGGTGGTDYNQCTMPVWQAGVWSHFTFVYDGKVLSAYENGTLVRTASVNTGASAPDSDFYLGGSSNGASINGSLDEARLLYGAASADWIAADYATQARADFLALTGLTDARAEVFGDMLSVVGGCVISNAAGKMTAVLMDAQSAVVDTKELTVAAGGIDYRVTFDGLAEDSDYKVRLTLTTADGEETVAVRTLGVRTLKRYALIANDTRLHSSLLPNASGGGQANNWTNVTDGTTLQYPTGVCDYVVLQKLIRTPDGEEFPANSVVRFAGKRLTVIGKGNDTVPDDFGTLALKHSNFTVAIDRLVLRSGGCVAQSQVDQVAPLDACIEIPEGEAGYLEMTVSETTKSVFNRIYGSVIGSGTFVLQMRKYVRESCGAYFYNDWSGFSGKVTSVKGGTYRLLGDFAPAGACAELTTDALTFDMSNTVYVDKDVETTARTRGLTLAETGSLNVAVTNGCTLKLVYPLYGSGAINVFGTNGYHDATLELAASQGDWTGTLSATNGTIVLSGVKPLGEGTLDVTDAATVEIDAAALAGGTCYLKAATAATRVKVRLPDAFDPEAGLAVITTPAEGGLVRAQIDVLGGLPADCTIRSAVTDDRVVFTVGKKTGLVIVFR